MKTYVSTDKNPISKNCYRQENINAVLEKVAETTDPTELVVAIYLLSNNSIWQGYAIREQLGLEDFHCHIGRKWSFARSFEAPRDLPEKYGLIRMAFGTSARYPKTIKDKYGWKERVQSFDDHVAGLFAHELHHFRRRHLGLHPGEGEQSACKWALQRAKEAGFQVEGVRVIRRKRHKRQKRNIRLPLKRNHNLVRRVKLIARYLGPEDLKELEQWIYDRRTMLHRQQEQRELEEHFEKFRVLPDGAKVKILNDPNCVSLYAGQVATKIRTPRRNSHRLVIRTADGKDWRWLMRWLEVVE